MMDMFLSLEEFYDANFVYNELGQCERAFDEQTKTYKRGKIRNINLNSVIEIEVTERKIYQSSGKKVQSSISIPISTYILKFSKDHQEMFVRNNHSKEQLEKYIHTIKEPQSRDV